MVPDLVLRWGFCWRRASPPPRRPSEGERERAAWAPLPMVFTVPLGLLCICCGKRRGERLRSGEAAGEGEGERERGRRCGWGWGCPSCTWRLLSLLERSSTRGADNVLRAAGRLLAAHADGEGASRKGTEGEGEKENERNREREKERQKERREQRRGIKFNSADPFTVTMDLTEPYRTSFSL